VLSLEMFERDVQEPLDHFAMGHMEEKDFLAASRPWPRYATDYKPLVDLALAKDWPVIAANVPRRIASEISKGGLDVLKGKPAEERAYVAKQLWCPLDDEYFTRFIEAMGSHPPAGSGGAANAAVSGERFYFAQCVKDETMAESIAEAHAAIPAPRPVIVHVNGAFHSDFGQGTAARVARRLPTAKLAIVSIKPVTDLDALDPTSDRARADWIVYTIGK
jgi:uncharacterized iron-regulated protein